MDPQVGGSFIPKKPLDSGIRGRGGITGLFFLLTLLVFAASLVAAGAEFGYQTVLQSQLVSKSGDLKKVEDSYQPAAIEDLLRVDARINQAEVLFKKHISVSALFDFLGTQTLEKVSWNNFEYVLKPDGSASLTLKGDADSFSTIALQSDQFGGNKFLKDVVFSNITVGASNTIGFGVSATVDSSVLRYANASTTP